MIDLSIPVVLGTVVAEVVVVIGSFSFSNYLNRGGQVKFGFNSGSKMVAHEWDDATQGKPSPKKISYKDEKESYFDHSATATQMKFELTQIMSESSDVTPTLPVKANSKSS
jgi:hypothetical protein